MTNLQFSIIKVGQKYCSSPYHAGLGSTASFFRQKILSEQAASQPKLNEHIRRDHRSALIMIQLKLNVTPLIRRGSNFFFLYSTLFLSSLRRQICQAWHWQCHYPSERNLNEFKIIQKDYKRCIRRAKRSSWKKFCSDVEYSRAMAFLNKVIFGESGVWLNLS